MLAQENIKPPQVLVSDSGLLMKSKPQQLTPSGSISSSDDGSWLVDPLQRRRRGIDLGCPQARQPADLIMKLEEGSRSGDRVRAALLRARAPPTSNRRPLSA